MSALYFAYARDARERGGSMQEGAGGLDVVVRVADREEAAFKGKLDFAENRIDNATGTMRVRARFANPDGILQPGMFGRINVPGSLPHQGILVPDEAIGADQDRRIVYVVDDDGMVSAKPVRTGPRIDGYRVIREGLTGDETIVVNGLMRVRPGVKVKAEMVTLPPEGRDRRAAAMRFAHFFVDRPIFASVAFDRPADRRRHRLYAAAGRAISRDRAADHRRARRTIRAPTPRPSPPPSRRRSSRRSTASRTCSTCRPIRSSDGAMALTITFKLGTDLDQAQVLVQNRVVDRRAAPAGRGAPPRHHHRQELARPDDGRAHAVAGRHLRPALRLQLCALARARHAAAARRRRRPHHLRRARIFAAHLARSGKARPPTA